MQNLKIASGGISISSLNESFLEEVGWWGESKATRRFLEEPQGLLALSTRFLYVITGNRCRCSRLFTGLKTLRCVPSERKEAQHYSYTCNNLLDRSLTKALC